MRPPAHIMIFGVAVPVRLCERETFESRHKCENLDGRSWRNQIEIVDDLDLGYASTTLLHESLHIALDQVGLDPDEDTIRRLECIMTSMLSENGAGLQWLSQIIGEARK